MKINYTFVKRDIAGETFLVPVGEAASVFEGIISLNPPRRVHFRPDGGL